MVQVGQTAPELAPGGLDSESVDVKLSDRQREVVDGYDVLLDDEGMALRGTPAAPLGHAADTYEGVK
jgi:alkyl hydroperoxide reductase subunit AhpC